MDQTHSDLYLLHIPRCRDAVDCLQHCEGWIREQGSVNLDRELICILRIAHKLISPYAAFKTFQSTRATSKFLVHNEAFEVVVTYLITETHHSNYNDDTRLLA